MIHQKGNNTLRINDKQALKSQVPLPTCEIELTDATFEYQGEAEIVLIRTITLSGLAWGLTKLDVTIGTPWITPPPSQSVNVSNAEWIATFDLSSSLLPYGGTVTVQLDTTTGAGCDAHATESIMLGTTIANEAVLKPAMGSPSGFEAIRNYEVGGFADRFTMTRYYVPLTFSYWVLPPHDKKKLVGMIRPLVGAEKAGIALDYIKKEILQKGKKFDGDHKGKNGVEIASLTSLVGKAFAKLPDKMASLQSSKVAEVAADTGAIVVNKVTKAIATNQIPIKEGQTSGVGFLEFPGGLTFALPAPAGKEKPDLASLFSGSQGVIVNDNHLAIGISRGIHHFTNLGWLGVLYYDRLRLRPSGLFAGEQVFSLTLAPGEEVTLTQKSETKRSKRFEDVQDQTTEKSLEFQSVWSTELSQEDTEGLTNKFGVDMHTPLGDSTPSPSAGTNAEETYNVSAKQSSKVTQQVTAKLTNKATQQHKITFEIKTEVTDENTSKRVVRNYNPARVLTLNYYKLYQKYRAVLERYDAKLCMSYCIEDPSKELRDELVAEINKFNQPSASAQPDADCGSVDTANGSTEQKALPNQGHIDDASDGKDQAEGTFVIQLPTGHVLVEAPKVKIDQWTWGYYDSSKWNSTSEDNFYSQGGRVFILRGSQINQPGPQTITVLFDLPVCGTFERGWKTGEVDAHLEFKSAPSDVAKHQIQDCLDAATATVKASFSSQRVQQLIDQLKDKSQTLVEEKLLGTLFPGLDDASISLDCATLEDVRLWFDWEGIGIEYLPWWLAPSGRQNYTQIKEALAILPSNITDGLSLDDLFMSSYARVYLPIQDGFEWEVVAAWAHVDNDDDRSYLRGRIDDFTKWRQDNLGPITYPLPDFEQISQIGPAIGTQTGKTAWEHDWEKPRRKFQVLDEWAVVLPTDGVHAEPMLSSDGAADEFRTTSLLVGISQSGSTPSPQNQ